MSSSTAILSGSNEHNTSLILMDYKIKPHLNLKITALMLNFKVPNMVDDKDKISQLPDDILLKFLTILDFKNAMRTSILAKRWKYLWTFLIDMDLDPANMSLDSYKWDISPSIGPQGYLNWVNQVVNAHRGPFIRKYKVFIHSKWRNPVSQLEKCAMFAFSKRVEELDLNFRAGHIDASGYPTRFSLGFDILKHPRCYNGIGNLKSLRLLGVDVDGDTLEFILLQCHLLEELCVFGSDTLLTLNIVSYKLKHLALMCCKNLKELEIDAVNLLSFLYNVETSGLQNNLFRSLGKEKIYSGCFRTNIVFKSVPNLVEVDFNEGICVYPFPFLLEISCISKQLTKLSLCPNVIDIPVPSHFKTPMKIDVLFPNVKHVTLTVYWLNTAAIVFIKFFIDVCPVLHEFKLQILWNNSRLKENANQQNERIDEISQYQNSYNEAQKEKVVNYGNGHRNLKVVELVGFHGSDNDINKRALDIIADYDSIEILICDPRSSLHIGKIWDLDDVEKTNAMRRQARNLAKLLPPKIHLGVRDKCGLFWVS